jgi:protein involved in polysaccharide export with SLBB domain
MDKTSLPAYVVEPPDILLIDAIKLVPKPPYRIEPLDVLQILVVGTLLDQPITGQFPVNPEGQVDLGPSYGKVRISGQTLDEAQRTIVTHLKGVLRAPEVSVSLFQTSGQQIVQGEHLVAPDGTVNLGTYGRVYVAGMTIDQVKTAIETNLGQYLENPRVSVDVFAYNSKVYYVITEGAGFGDNVVRVPVTGNETVLDAIAQINGLSRLSSKKIWIARPAPGGVGCDQILPVNWEEITKGASTATNYQVLPGDRIFLAESKLIALDSFITRLTGPFERVFGFSLLGAQSVQTFNRFPLGFQGGSN